MAVPPPPLPRICISSAYMTACAIPTSLSSCKNSVGLKIPNHLLPRKTTQIQKKASISISIFASMNKIVRSPSLDRNVVKQNKLRFVQKLKTLILSKPKHYIHLQILRKCRSYLSLPPGRSILSMIRRYPTIFHLFKVPSPSQELAVSLTPEAAAIAYEESKLKLAISDHLATKFQKLLMLSSHRRLLLSKLVHLAPDLGFPPNFRSRLCNEYSDRFRTVDTSYGRALELVSWDPQLTSPMPKIERPSDLIVDRPPKFKMLKLRRGLNLKRKHRDFLLKFDELPEISPYSELVYEPHSLEAEKRACAVVREILGMTVEKRILIDHLTHFRTEMILSNKLRGMLVRHPEMFYVSLKGQRDSVFLVEGYDDNGRLLKKDELSVFKEKLMELVREGKRMRRKARMNERIQDGEEEEESDHDDDIYGENDIVDDFGDLFEHEIDNDWEDLGDTSGEEVVNELLSSEEFWKVGKVEDIESIQTLGHW